MACLIDDDIKRALIALRVGFFLLFKDVDWNIFLFKYITSFDILLLFYNRVFASYYLLIHAIYSYVSYNKSFSFMLYYYDFILL